MAVTKHISLGFMQQGDSRKPRKMRLMIQTEDLKVETLVDMNEHQFAAFMSGQSIKVQAEL